MRASGQVDKAVVVWGITKGGRECQMPFISRPLPGNPDGRRVSREQTHGNACLSLEGKLGVHPGYRAAAYKVFELAWPFDV